MQKPTNSQPVPAPVKTPPTQPHHHVRTYLASLLGTFTVVLILLSVVLVWLNRTLTNTPTYVKTVAPLATKPEIQNFIADKTSQELVKNAPTQDLAEALLTPAAIAGQTPQQLQEALKPVIYSSVKQVITGPDFAKLWRDTNQTAHASLTKQLISDSDQLNLDFTPVVTSVVNQLKTTQLASVSDKIEVKPDTGKLSLKGTGIEKAHNYYRAFKAATVAIVVVALLAFVLSIVASVHHIKTTRRILIGTGLVSLLFSFAIQLPSILNLQTDDPIAQKAAVAIVQTVLHSLQVTSLTVGFVCIAGAISSKIYQKVNHRV